LYDFDIIVKEIYRKRNQMGLCVLGRATIIPTIMVLANVRVKRAQTMGFV
jgi:hypothetical protein